MQLLVYLEKETKPAWILLKSLTCSLKSGMLLFDHI
jgi:hypothetical protein